MKILITNDDSITAPGLKSLYRHVNTLGETFIIAPLVEQSAKSHAININGGIQIGQYDLGLRSETFFCDSTPADCVRAAFYFLNYDFDFVFSGINNGYNLGEDVFYSGTVAAATEGAFLGKSGLAFSTAAGYLDIPSKVFSDIMRYIEEKEILSYCNLLNINIPTNPRGILITVQGNTNFDAKFIVNNGLCYQQGEHQYHLENNQNTDVWAINNNYVSITPLTLDRTNYKIINKYQK